jgi:hypothetical protein
VLRRVHRRYGNTRDGQLADPRAFEAINTSRWLYEQAADQAPPPWYASTGRAHTALRFLMWAAWAPWLVVAPLLALATRALPLLLFIYAYLGVVTRLSNTTASLLSAAIWEAVSYLWRAHLKVRVYRARYLAAAAPPPATAETPHPGPQVREQLGLPWDRLYVGWGLEVCLGFPGALAVACAIWAVLLAVVAVLSHTPDWLTRWRGDQLRPVGTHTPWQSAVSWIWPR